MDQNTSVSARYQFKPFLGSSHAWALNHLKQLSSSSKILDVGPGNGDMARFLKEKGITDIIALEVDQTNIKHLEQCNLYNTIKEDLSAVSGIKFDCVLLLDVLEHMVDPFSFLEQLQDYLATGSIILISVPNIAHWSIRLSLLFGYFEYTKRGILDQTHLQFFNRRRFTKLLKHLTNCTVLELAASIEPVEFVLPNWIANNKSFITCRSWQHNLAQKAPGFFAYQHLTLLQSN